MMSRAAYQIPLYVCYPAPAILILTLPFLHESPRWLLQHGKPEAALRSLQFFRKGVYDEVALQQEYEEMRAAAARTIDNENSKGWLMFFEVFRGSNLRRTIIAVAVGTANAGIGAMFILAFGTYFFKVVSLSERPAYDPTRAQNPPRHKSVTPSSGLSSQTVSVSPVCSPPGLL
jgi:SP family sugar:H+ symporter-like MFS transporter